MASCENPIGKVTAARQKNITATKPTHLAYGVTVRSQSVAISRTIVVVTQIHPQNTYTKVISHEGLRVGVKQVEGRVQGEASLHESKPGLSPHLGDNPVRHC